MASTSNGVQADMAQQFAAAKLQFQGELILAQLALTYFLKLASKLGE
jgi:hypothetical protein